MNSSITFISVLAIIFLTACASNIPLEIRQDISENPVSIEGVRNELKSHDGDHVRWGGIITNIENKATETWVEVVGKPLNNYGRPGNGEVSLGRFLVRIDGFLDPEIYKPDRRITIYGQIESRIVRKIDEHPYTYPLVKAKSYYLWKEYVRYPYPHYAYYTPYYPYPYRYHFGFHFGHHFGHHYRHHYPYHFGFSHYYHY